MSEIKHKKIIQNIFLLIGVAALAIMVCKIGLHTIFENIKETGWWILPVISIWVFVYLLNTISAMMIIRDGTPQIIPLKFTTLLKITISTFALNSATPIGLAGGEPYKIMELKPFLGGNKATSTVILFSTMHFVAHFIFWMGSILLAAIMISMKEGWAVFLIVTFGCCLLMTIFFFKGYQNGMVMKFLNIVKNIPFLKRKIDRFTNKNRENIQIIDTQIKLLHKEKKTKFFVALGIELASRILSCLEIYFLFLALNFHINFTYCILIMAFTSLFANILFFAPMQLGTREGGFLLAFGALGLPSAWAISISLITRIRELFWMLIGVVLMKIK